MGIPFADLLDQIITTQHNDNEGKWTDLTSDRQNHIGLSRILQKKHVTMESGKDLRFNLKIDHNDSAKTTEPYSVDVVNVKNTHRQGLVPWRQTTANFAIDEFELKTNSGARQIVSLINSRIADMNISNAEIQEPIVWGKPTDSTDVTTPWGLAYWIVSATSDTEGFNGGLPSGFSDIAGLSLTDVPRFKNWNGRYVTVSQGDVLAKIREAKRKTRFLPPVPGMSLNNTIPRNEIYTNSSVLGQYEQLAENRNDNLGKDLIGMFNATMLDGIPALYVSDLDDDSTDPIMGINWDSFKVTFLQGSFMERTSRSVVANMHTVFQGFLDNTYNIVCNNRRLNWIFNTA